MRYGEFIDKRLLDEMEYYCQKLALYEKKMYGVEPFKGKSHLWVEKLHDSYVIYGSDGKTWFAEYYNQLGMHIGVYENINPFDYKAKGKEAK